MLLTIRSGLQVWWTKRSRTGADAAEVVQEAVSEAFLRVLEDAGVFKRTPEGQQAFRRFVEQLR